MRRLSQAMDEIKLEDPNTAITPYHLRSMVLSGELPCHHAGRTMLIDMDILFSVLGGETATKQQSEAPGNFFQNNVRKIGG